MCSTRAHGREHHLGERGGADVAVLDAKQAGLGDTHDLVGDERLELDSALGRGRCTDEGELEVAGEQPAEDLVARGDLDLDLDLRVVGAEAAERVGEQVDAGGGRGAEVDRARLEPASSASSSSARRAASAWAARAESARPASVRRLPRPLRSNSRCPAALSSTRRCSLAVDWVIPTTRAAPETLPWRSSSTSRRIRFASQAAASVDRCSVLAMAVIGTRGSDDSWSTLPWGA